MRACSRMSQLHCRTVCCSPSAVVVSCGLQGERPRESFRICCLRVPFWHFVFGWSSLISLFFEKKFAGNQLVELLSSDQDTKGVDKLTHSLSHTHTHTHARTRTLECEKNSERHEREKRDEKRVTGVNSEKRGKEEKRKE